MKVAPSQVWRRPFANPPHPHPRTLSHKTRKDGGGATCATTISRNAATPAYCAFVEMGSHLLHTSTRRRGRVTHATRAHAREKHKKQTGRRSRLSLSPLTKKENPLRSQMIHSDEMSATRPTREQKVRHGRVVFFWEGRASRAEHAASPPRLADHDPPLPITGLGRRAPSSWRWMRPEHGPSRARFASHGPAARCLCGCAADYQLHNRRRRHNSRRHKLDPSTNHSPAPDLGATGSC